MADWVDPFTGQWVETDTAPLGGPYPMSPKASVSVIPTPDFTVPGVNTEWSPDRGRLFYMPGDEWSIISSQSDLVGLQSALDDAGLISGDYLSGSPDRKTAAAMKTVLEAANASGQSWQEVLGRGLEAAQAKAAAKGGTGRLMPNPDDIKKLGNSTARDLIGMDFTPEQQDAFVNAFTAALEPQGGYQAPDPSTIAETYIENTMPGEVGAQTGTDHFEAFLKMLGGL